MALNDPHHVRALDARYGSQPKPAGLLWNETIATILGHRSVRAYSDEPLAPGTIETLVAAAQSASSSSNLQAWSVIAVTDRLVKGKLAILAGNQRHIDDAPLILLWVADLGRIERLGEAHAKPTAALDYLDSFLVAATDVALAAQNASLAAESLGLGTVYIGALRNNAADVAELVGLPRKASVIFGLVVGHPDPNRPAEIKPRLRQDAVLHRERYSTAAETVAIENYDEASRAFQAGQGLPETGWSPMALARSADAQALYGRHTLRDTIAGQGFPLL